MSVQYMRPYTVEEMAALQVKLGDLFSSEPSFIALTVLAMELRRHLELDFDKADDRPRMMLRNHDATEPEIVTYLREALDRFIPPFVQTSVKGISSDEVPS